MGTLVPARTLAPGRVAVGVSAGLVAPTGELLEEPDGSTPFAAAAATVAAPGLGPALGVRAGIVKRIEGALALEPARASLALRWAFRRPSKSWDLTFAARGAAAWTAPDGDEELEVESFTGAGGGLEARMGRTWSDFLSLWIAAQVDGGAWSLDARWNGDAASDHGTVMSVAAVLGVRVGFRNFFTGMELTARWLTAAGETGSASGLLLSPAFGISIETR